MKYTESLYQATIGHASHKKDFNIMQLTILSFLAGCYVAFGINLMTKVGGHLMVLVPTYKGLYNVILGTFGLPFGLTLIIVCGGELFTSDCSYMMTGLLERKLNLLTVARTLIVSYFGNIAGCLFVNEMMWWADVYDSVDVEFLSGIAEVKTSHSFQVTFLRAMMANWFVNLAVLLANGADDLMSKFIGIWLPISSFVAIGLEHCIANLCTVPLAIKLGADVSVNHFIVANVIPATLGNIIGGAFFVSTLYYICFGRVNIYVNAKLDEIKIACSAIGNKITA